jgi:hypothetical protein
VTQTRLHWSWPGIIGVILAVTLGAGWGTTLVLSALDVTNVSNDAYQLLNGIGQVLAGAVATFMGSAIAGSAAARTTPDPVGGPVAAVGPVDPVPATVTPPPPISALRRDPVGGVETD